MFYKWQSYILRFTTSYSHRLSLESHQPPSATFSLAFLSSKFSKYSSSSILFSESLATCSGQRSSRDLMAVSIDKSPITKLLLLFSPRHFFLYLTANLLTSLVFEISVIIVLYILPLVLIDTNFDFSTF